MGQFFDSRRFLRTPGFAQDGLYDDEAPLPRTSTDDNGNEIALPPRNPLPDDNGMVEGQPLPPRKPIDWMDRIENLPPRPLPAPPSRLRGAMAGFLGAYNPEAGEEIRHPGYKDDVRRWEAEQERLAGQLKMTQGMSQVQANEARRRAEEARAGAQGSLSRKYDAERDYVGKKPITVNRNERLYDPSANKVLLDAAESEEKLPNTLEAAAARALGIKDPAEREDTLKRIADAHNLLHPEKPISRLVVGDDGQVKAVTFKPSDVAAKGGAVNVADVYKNPPKTKSSTGSGIMGDMEALADEIEAGRQDFHKLTATEKQKVRPTLTKRGWTEPKVLSESAQKDIAVISDLENLTNRLLAMEKNGSLPGLGPVSGRIGALGDPVFAWSDEDARTARQLLGQIRGTIAKLQSGTALSENELNLLNTYIPQQESQSKPTLSRLKNLQKFLSDRKANRTSVAPGGNSPSAEGGGQNQGPVKMTDGKVTRLVPFEYIKQFEARGYKKK